MAEKAYAASVQVRLRALAREDAEAVVRWRAQPEVASQLFSARAPSLEEHRAWFERYLTRADRREWIIEAGPRFAPIGSVGLSQIDHVASRAELGILIGESWARGVGVASQATRLLLEHAFGVASLRRVFLHVFADNHPAIRLYERHGFVREGCLRQHALRQGVATDVLVMGLLRDEHQARTR